MLKNGCLYIKSKNCNIMNVHNQYPAMTDCGARMGGCRCTPNSRSSDTDKRNNPETNFPRSEYSYKSTSPYEDWSVLDDEDQNTLTALRNKACNFIMTEPEEVSAKALPHSYSYDPEPQYVYPSLVRKANDMIDYAPQSEFLKKMKQQCQFLESYRPNIFSAIAEGMVNESFDIEKFVEETTRMAREAPYPNRRCKTATDGTARQRCQQRLPVSNELHDESCRIDRNDLTYLVEGIEPSDQNLIQSKSGKKKKSEHISRSKTPHKGRGRRKRKSGSGEAGEIECEGGFEPTLKRPHENSCERCWRFASPSRSPVNKPDQKYDPNFRRGHSCYDFERGDADVYDRHISPCKNLEPLTSKEKMSSPIPVSSFVQKTPSSNFPQNIPPPTFPQKTQPLGFPQKTPVPGYPQKTPLPGFQQNTPSSSLPQNSTSSSLMQRTPSARPKECISLWQKPATVQTASEPVYQQRLSEMHPSPQPAFQSRISEVHPSPQPAFQSKISEMHPSPHPACQNRISEVHTSPQPAFQSRISEMHPSPHPSFQHKVTEVHPSPQPAFQSRISEMHPSPHPACQNRISEVHASPQPAFQSRISEMHPSPHPAFQSRISEMHPSPRPAFQQECLASSHPVTQKAVPISPQSVRQQKPQGQFRSGQSPTRISFYDNYPDGSPERTVLGSPVLDCPVDPNHPIIYSEPARTRPRGVQIMPEQLPDIPPVEMQRFSDNFNGLNVTEYKTFPSRLREQTTETAYSRSSPPGSIFDGSYHSPRQQSPRPCSAGLGTIIEAADSDSSKSQLLKEEEKTPKCKKVKSPKNSSKQSLGSPRSPGSNRGGSPSKVHTPNKSGSPKKGKPKSPSPKPSPVKSQSGGGKSPDKSRNESKKCQKISPQKQKSPEPSKRTRSSIEVNNTQPPTPEQRPRTSDPRVKDRSPAKSPVKEGVTAPAEEYDRPDHPFTDCPCQPPRSVSNDPDYQPSHLICCHCNWQERLRKQADQHKTSPQAEGNRRVSPEKILQQNPKGYDSVAYRCPYLAKTSRQGSGNSPEPFGEAEIRLMRDHRKEMSYEDLSPIPCSPRQYFVFYMTKSKEDKADDDVEVLVEELTQSCPKKADSRTKDITERMKKIMECPSDSMALRFQKGVFEPCKVPQSSRILYF